MSSPEVDRRLAELQEALRRVPRGRLAIPLNGYPDPDAIASAWALSQVAATAGATAQILHCYPISHPENRKMVRVLGIPMQRVKAPTDRLEYGYFALVDAATLDSHFEALRARPCVTVWDHHDGKLGVAAQVPDIRRSVGATSTIATEYLAAAGLLDAERRGLVDSGQQRTARHGPLSRLATALLLGIATDTQDYLLAHAADFAASARLIVLADRDTLRHIHHRTHSVAAMDALRRALDSVQRRGRGGVAWIESVHPSRRDTIPQAADLLLTRSDLDTVVVFGRVANTIDGSVRTSRSKLDVAGLIVRALGVEGFSGGRECMGGFRLPLDDVGGDAVDRYRERISEGFLRLFAELKGEAVKG